MQAGGGVRAAGGAPPLACPNVPSPNLRMILKRGARFSPISNW